MLRTFGALSATTSTALKAGIVTAALVASTIGGTAAFASALSAKADAPPTTGTTATTSPSATASPTVSASPTATVPPAADSLHAQLEALFAKQKAARVQLRVDQWAAMDALRASQRAAVTTLALSCGVTLGDKPDRAVADEGATRPVVSDSCRAQFVALMKANHEARRALQRTQREARKVLESSQRAEVRALLDAWRLAHPGTGDGAPAPEPTPTPTVSAPAPSPAPSGTRI